MQHEQRIIGQAEGYQLLCLAGDGGQACTYLAKKNNQHYIAKIYFPIKASQYYEKQTKMMQKLNNPYVIKLIQKYPHGHVNINMVEDIQPFYIMQFAEHGDLFTLANYNKLSQPVIRTWFSQLIQSLIHLKQINICHRDIKLQNILLGSKFQLKLADFGYACCSLGPKNDGWLEKFDGGTIMYVAPQVYDKRYRGERIDIFACGVVLFLLMLKYPPFDHTRNGTGNYNLIRQNRYNQFWQKFGKFKVSDSFKRFINKLFAQQQKRITLQQIQYDEWMSGQKLTNQQMMVYLQPKYDALQRRHQTTRNIRQRLGQNLERINANINLAEMQRQRSRDRNIKWNKLQEDISKIKNETKQIRNIFIFGLKYAKVQPCLILLWLGEYLSICQKQNINILNQSIQQTKLENYHIEVKQNCQIQLNLYFLHNLEEGQCTSQIVLNGKIIMWREQYALWWKIVNGSNFWGKNIIFHLQRELWQTYV